MRAKARLFRVLRLESLDVRAVFSVDGFAGAGQFARQLSDLDFELVQADRARPSGIAARIAADCGRETSQGLRTARDSSHKHHDDDDTGNPRLQPEGEDPPLNPVSTPAPPRRDPNSLPGRVSQPPVVAAPSLTFIVAPFPSALDVLPIAVVPAHPTLNLPRVQIENNNPRISNPSGPPNSAGTGGLTNPLANNSLSVSTSFIAAPAVASPVNSIAQSNHSAFSSLSLSAEKASFDFSTGLEGGESRRVLGSSDVSQNEFKFTKPQTIIPDSIFAPALMDGAAGIASLEIVLADLAENHRRTRTQNSLPAKQSDHRELDWRSRQSEQSLSASDLSFADGGLIAIALNRDLAIHELGEIAGDDSSENKAWTANVGIFRAFENGALAATHYAGLTNRTARNADSLEAEVSSPEVEAEVSNSPIHPLLTSSSAALGVLLVGLRRIRKSTRWMQSTPKP